MARISRVILLAAGALGLAAGVVQAGQKGPKSPETPFKLYIYSRTRTQDALDSAQDVRKIVQDKKADWFTLTDDRRGADVVLDVRSRDYSKSTHFIVRGRVSTVNLDEADVIGQGQEAPIAIYSMASSTAADAPRGMEFLYSRHRLNVATSRAHCLAVVVASPALFQVRCHTPRQMRLASGLCRLLEMTVGASARTSVGGDGR